MDGGTSEGNDGELCEMEGRAEDIQPPVFIGIAGVLIGKMESGVSLKFKYRGASCLMDQVKFPLLQLTAYGEPEPKSG